MRGSKTSTAPAGRGADILLINTRFMRKHEQSSWQRANGTSGGASQGFSKSSSSLKSSSDPASSIKSSSPPIEILCAQFSLSKSVRFYFHQSKILKAFKSSASADLRIKGSREASEEEAGRLLSALGNGNICVLQPLIDPKTPSFFSRAND
jgi:hypothetical protein